MSAGRSGGRESGVPPFSRGAVEEARCARHVLVGRAQLSDSGKGKLRHVETVEIHPRYGTVIGYDIAAVKLTEPANGITPVRLPTRGTDAMLRPGQEATASAGAVPMRPCTTGRTGCAK
ncbi:trypsin-like serine protease [Kitasatospora aureofaciens]|uniref:trypsin-like serine protease n=1 Tax=Kitasatospora aureofaciens TaxID=1894 RepID=UPI0037CAC2C0